MQSQMTRVVAGALLAAGLWSASVDAATRYRATTVDVPFPGAKNTTVTGINGSTWVGTFTHDDTGLHGWMQAARRKPFVMHPRMPLHDINRWGYTVWSFLTPELSGSLSGSLFTRTQVFTISCFDFHATEAVGMNDHTMVVGNCFDPDLNTYHSYTFDRKTGSFEIFDPPFASKTGSGANDLNSDGTIVGGFDSSGYMRLPDGTFLQIHVPESTWTTPHSINNHGEVTGLTCTQGMCQCFVRAVDGTLTLFAVPGAQGTVCYVISDAGELGGVFGYTEDESHGFVARPSRRR